MSDLNARRRYYAEEIEVSANLRSRGLAEALASVPRERFLPPGPWTIRAEADPKAPPRQTPDADPRHVYHNVAIAIDARRTLFNGAPSVLAAAIDTLALAPGQRVLHQGTGLGYYTAVIAHCVGPSGRVVGLEVDSQLADEARLRLAEYPWVEVRQGDGSETIDECFDAMLINAGVTHPLRWWLDALAPNGRLQLPITATMAAMGTIGKGPMLLVTKTSDDRMAATITGFVAIYSALGIRDDEVNGRLGRALSRMPFAPIKSLRRDAHDVGPSCWLHTTDCCLSLDPPT